MSVKHLNIKSYWRERAKENSVDIRNQPNHGLWDSTEKEIILKNVEHTAPILDLGCGNGRILEFLEDKTDSKLYGIDYVKENVIMAKQNCRSAVIKQMDATKLDFHDNFFGTVISCRTLQSLQTVEDKSKALHEIHRVLTD